MNEWDINSINNNNREKQKNNLRGYIVFWIGQLISLLGSNIVQFTIIWWITVETGSEFFLALSTFLGFAPTIFFTSIAGVFVDRWSRKKLIASVDFLQAIVTMGLILSFMIGIVNIWIVLAIITLRGIFQSFHEPAVQAIIPLLVPRDKLSRLNGLDYLFNGMILMVGPIVGALLLKFFSIQDILWIDFITFLIAIIPTVIISIPSVKPQKKIEDKSSFITDLAEGFNFVRTQRGLLVFLSVFTAANFFIYPLYVLSPLFITEIHLGEAEELAIFFSLIELGSISSSLIMSFWKGFKNNTYGVALGIFMMYLGFLFIVLSPQRFFFLLALGAFLNGFGIPITNVSSQTIWQKIVPPEKLGRVYSVRLTVAHGAGPIAIILSGIIGEIYGIIPVFLLSAVFGLLFLSYSWLFTGFRNIEKTVTSLDSPQSESVALQPQPLMDS